MITQEYIQHILQNLPQKPGVYKMKNKDGEIIYVGKAKNLKSRVSSYFQNRNDKAMRTIKMVEHIVDIEYIEVGSELEALILETNLIKEIRPKYNILMKDDKNYVYVKITVDEAFPRIFLVRKVSKDKARYFGPKTAAHKVIKTLKVLKKIFPFRHCQLTIDYIFPEIKNSDQKNSGFSMTSRETVDRVKVTHANIKFPCLDYHIKRCCGPCIGKVNPEEYRKIIDQVIRFLEGKHEEITDKLQEEMKQAALTKQFEKAAAIRDKLQIIAEITETQRISDPHQKNLDIIHYVQQDSKIYFNLFQLRNGKLLGQENFIFQNLSEQEEENPEALSAFLEQYYEKATDLPQEILIPHEIDDQEILETWLQEMKGFKVHFVIPERGKKNQLLELSLQNAQSFANQSVVKWQGIEKESRQAALEGLKKLLNLSSFPTRLECFDNSHFGGTETVSSMVVFENGFPKKSDYRHFKLHQQTAGSPDDFASMEETLTRRLKYLKPSLQALDLRVRKASKKDAVFLLKELKMEKLPEFLYYIIEKGTQPIGFFQITATPNKKFFIEKVVVEGNVELPILMKKLVQKLKIKRVYFVTDKEDIPKYEEFGFQIVRKLPEDYRLQEGKSFLVYDSNQYIDDPSFKKMPQLIVVDGGKGQLHSAQKAMKKYDLYVPMIGLAKREEEIFLPDISEPIILEKHDPILHMIQHIRDEAHRFAITYHQGLRMKATRSSILDSISGIGPELKMKLLREFGSPEDIYQASEEQVAAIVGRKNAANVKKHLAVNFEKH